jgi:membrane protein implicated in regulation of membrane protease activity
MDLLPALNAFTVFLAIAGVGFAFLMLSLLFGEVFEHFGDGLDHDLDHGGPGFFSTRVLSVFVTTFGGVGAIATYYGLSPVASSVLAFGSGFVLSSVVLAFGRFLYRQQATSEVRTNDLVGQNARVVIAIPPGGVGQVRCRIGEELVDKIARARDGDVIPENAAVRVDEVLGETVVVSALRADS